MSMYTNQERVEAFLKRELTEYEMVLLDETIESVSDEIETYTNRKWQSLEPDEEESDEATARIFDGSGTSELYVDDFIGLEKVRILDRYSGDELVSYTKDTDWVLSPGSRNPKQSIRLRNAHFYNGIGNVEITAVWGSGAPPKGVIAVATALVAGRLGKSGDITGQFKRESIEGYSYEKFSGSENFTDDETLMHGLDSYKKFIL